MTTPSTILRCLLSTLLLLSPVVASAQPATAPAAAADTARAHFENGVALYREGDFRGALIEFRRAYEIGHNYRALYNIGQTSFEVQDYAGSLRSFQKYLADGGAEIDPERRAQVESDIKKLSARVARVTIKTNTPGADVLVDDVLVGKAPLAEPVLVSAGRRKVTVQSGELAPVTRVVDFAGGDASTIAIDLVAAKSDAVEQPRPSGPPRTALWVSLAVTGVLTAGAVTTGVVALKAHSDAEDKLGTRGISSSSVESADKKTRVWAATSDVLSASAVAMGVVSIVLLATSGSRAGEDRKPSVTLQVAPRGLGLTGQF